MQDVEMLLRWAKQIKKELNKKDKLFLDKLETAFVVEYTHNSTAIEGNTLTLMETKLVLEDKLSVDGKELREIYETVNHEQAYRYVQKLIENKILLSADVVKDLHEILVKNIFQGGIFRNNNVRITGATFRPPEPEQMFADVQKFFADLSVNNKSMNVIQYAAWTHAEFVRIHPFPDGNGRICRLLMNYQLMQQGLFPVSIAKENKLDYYKALEEYAVQGNLQPFSDFVFQTEKERLQELAKDLGIKTPPPYGHFL